MPTLATLASFPTNSRAAIKDPVRPCHSWPIFGLSLICLTAGAEASAAAPALPTGGQVQAGSAVISAPSGGTLTINQTSSRAIIDWSSFSIGQAGAVQFDNGSGATLNRVTGSGGSVLDGQLSGTGSVYLINPNGVIIGKTGVINVGGTFVASTLDVTNSQFLGGGDLTFSGPSAAAVINYGKIGALGGDVALIATRVENGGQINAANGDAGLLAGYQVELRDKALDGGKFAVLLGGVGTSATNSGVIEAAAAELRANGGNVFALAGNTGGLIKATAVSASGGKVFLVAEGGTVSLAGEIQARGLGGEGGSIETSGSIVQIGRANVDAGVGGSWLLDPDDLTIDQTAANTIAASLNAGTNVTQQTTAAGTGGNGDIFVVSNVTLDWTTNASLTLSAYRNINLGSGSTLASTGGGAITLYADNTGAGTGTVSFGSGASVSTAGAISIFYNSADNPAGSAINATSYTSPTDYSGFVSGGGALSAYMLVNTVNDLQNVENNLTGTYALGRDIDASATSGWNGGAGFIPIGGNGQAAFTGTLEGNGRAVSNLFIDYATNSSQFQYYGLGWDSSTNLPPTGGGWTTTGFVGLVGLLGAGGVIRDISLPGANITAGDGAFVGALAGLVWDAKITNASSSGSVKLGAQVTPTQVGSAFAGGLIGGAAGGSSIAGSDSSAAVVSGDNAVAGGLVGWLGSASTVAGSHATGAATNNSTMGGEAGGLVGAVYGPAWGGPIQPATISSSYATGSVSGGGNSDLGGLVGTMVSGQISGSYATGSVTQTGPGQVSVVVIGGLAGDILDGSKVTNSYATGSVWSSNGLAYEGGFIGLMFDRGSSPNSQINNSFATGSVTKNDSSSAGFSIIGGFVGYMGNGLISQSYSSGVVSAAGGITTAYYALVGGFVGNTGNTASITDSYAVGPVTITGSSNLATVGGFVGADGGSIMNAYSVGEITAPSGSAMGGFAGYLASPGVLSGVTWDVTSSGRSSGVGAVASGIDGSIGLTTAQLQSALPSGFNPAVWTTIPGETYPYLAWQFPSGTPQVVSGIATHVDGVTPYAGGQLAVSFGGSELNSVLTGGRVFSGANGYYYYLLAPGTMPASTANSVGVTLFYPGDPTTPHGQAANDGVGALADGSMLGLNVTSDDPQVRTIATSESQLQSDLASIFGPSYGAAIATLNAAGAATQVQATGNFVIDQSMNDNGPVLIQAGGALTENAGVSIAAAGPLTLASGGTMTLGGVVTAAANTLTLTSGGAINAAGATLTAAVLTGSAQGAATLTGSNQIAALGDFSDTAGSVSLNDASALAVTGTVNTGSNALTLTSAGAISEAASGSITTGTLNTSSVGGFSLGGGSNNIGTLGSVSNSGGGALSLYDSQSLTLSSAVTYTSGNLAIGSAENLTLDGAINAGANSLTLTAGGALTLNDTAIAGGDLTITAGGALTLNGTASSGGAMTVDSAGLLKLSGKISSGGPMTLDADGALMLRGTATSGGAMVLDSGGAMTLSGTVNATGSTLNLTSGGAITAPGALDAAILAGSADGAVTLTGPNQIAALGGFSDGASGVNVALSDGQALNVTGPLSAGGDNLSLTTTSGNITVSSPITANMLTLVSAGQALETAAGAIAVTTINVTAKTGINLNSTSNSIGAIGIDKTKSGTNVINQF